MRFIGEREKWKAANTCSSYKAYPLLASESMSIGAAQPLHPSSSVAPHKACCMCPVDICGINQWQLCRFQYKWILDLRYCQMGRQVMVC
jgi:hypothetical protein